MYELIDYARGRLDDTVIMIDGSPSFIKMVTGNRELVFRNLTLDDGGAISMDSDKVDLTPIPLGYLNSVFGASYLVRLAQRRWKQGLDKRAVMVRGKDCRREDWFYTEDMEQCLTNVYPSFEEAKALAIKDDITVAFNKRWAISAKDSLFHRGMLVGTCKKKVSLQKVYKYLQEILEEVI